MSGWWILVVALICIWWFWRSLGPVASKPQREYTYDPLGNRVVKIERGIAELSDLEIIKMPDIQFSCFQCHAWGFIPGFPFGARVTLYFYDVKRSMHVFHWEKTNELA